MIRANQLPYMLLTATLSGEKLVCNCSGMGGRRKHRKHAGPAASPAATNTNTGGGQPDSPTRLFALRKDVLAVAFGTALRAHDLRCEARDWLQAASFGTNPQPLETGRKVALSNVAHAGPAS